MRLAIDSVDQNVGKIIMELKSLMVYDNTLIMFLSDNGSAAEGGRLGSNKGPGEIGQGLHLPFTMRSSNKCLQYNSR